MCATLIQNARTMGGATQPAALAGAVVLAAGVGLAGLAFGADQAIADEAAGGAGLAEPAGQVEQATGAAQAAGVRSVANIEGTFAWDQGVSAGNEVLARSLYGAARVLCGSLDSVAVAGEAAGDASAQEVAAIEQIAVTGDVACAFSASVAEFEEKAPVRTIMGCTCAGNPADGRASANADVAGFQLSALIEQACPLEGANTITFVCADGYEVALPLSYVAQRYAIVVTAVNGQDCAEAVGCSNQLWLGTTAARSFARDVVEVRITCEDVAPAAPGAPTDANQPNVGVLAGAASA